MRSAILPLLIVLAPQTALSAVQLGVPVLAPAIVASMGLAPEAVGLIGGLIGFGSLWLFAANRAVTPVLGPLKALSVACILIVAGALAIATGLWAGVAVGAVAVGFAYAITAPAGSQILSQHTPREMWGTLFSVRQSGVPLGGAFAGIVGAGLAGAYGWRIGLLGLAVAPLVCLILFAFVAPRFRGGASGAPFRARAVFDPRNVLRPLRTLREMPALVPMTLASLGFAFGQGTVFSFLTTYLTDSLALSLVLAGALYSVVQVASFVGRIAAGIVADLLGSTRALLIAMAISSAFALLILAQMDANWSRITLFAWAIFAGLATATWNGLFLAEIAKLVPADRVSEATASSTFFTFVAYTVAPPLFGALVWVAGYTRAYQAMALLVLSAAAFLILGTSRGQTTTEPD